MNNFFRLSAVTSILLVACGDGGTTENKSLDPTPNACTCLAPAEECDGDTAVTWDTIGTCDECMFTEVRTDCAASSEVCDDTDFVRCVRARDPACAEPTENYEFLHTPPEVSGEPHTHSDELPADETSELVEAVVEDGVLAIRLEEEERVAGALAVLRIIIRTSAGQPAPGRFELVDEGHPTPDDVSYVTYAERLGPTTSTGLANQRSGEIRLQTCPNDVGDRAIGTVDAALAEGAGADQYVLAFFEGDFNVVVRQSDGSLECAMDPGVCGGSN